MKKAFNLKFEYLYRDAGNYKQHGSIILQNPTSLDPKKVTDLIKQHLIDGEFFDPETFNVPRLEIYNYDPELDNDWYEFERISETDEAATDSRTIEEFIMEWHKLNRNSHGIEEIKKLA